MAYAENTVKYVETTIVGPHWCNSKITWANEITLKHNNKVTNFDCDRSSALAQP